MGSLASPSIPTTQKAVVVQNAGPSAQISIQETPVPTFADDEVLIRLSHSSICHTDVAFAYGEWSQMGFGMENGNCTPGHEGVGHVVAVGAGVDNGLKVGDRVGTKWIRRVCGECSFCKPTTTTTTTTTATTTETGAKEAAAATKRERHEHLCLSKTVCGHASPGSLQQYMPSQASTTPKIPDAIPLDKAGPLLCAGVTMFRAVTMSRARRGEWIVIAGAGGGLGHLGVQFAHAMGLKIVGIDGAEKRDFCLALGVDHFIDFRTAANDDEAAVPDEVRRVCGNGGARAVLVPTGSRSSYEQAPRMLGPGGTLVCVGLPAGPFVLPLQLLEIISAGYTVTGVNASSLNQIEETLEFAAAHGITPSTQLLPMEKAGEAFELLKDARVNGRVVLDLQ